MEAGAFVSCSGFSEDAFKAFESTRRIVCMDGADLCEMFD
ncbi:restriction endonuclease [Salaquimonas pukyongi]